MSISTLFSLSLDHLLPRACLLCGCLAGSDAVCVGCRESLPLLPAPACPVCALPLPIPAPCCGACLAHPPAFDRSIAAWRYAPPLDSLIQWLKFGHPATHHRAAADHPAAAPADAARAAPLLASAATRPTAVSTAVPPGMARQADQRSDHGSDQRSDRRSDHRFSSADFFARQMLQGPLPAGDVIVPVPLSVERLRERGFNQALEIARPLARALQLPLDCRSVTRVRETAPQSRLPWRARHANMQHAFACAEDFSGRRVIVIDDVMTTGATLDALAHTLKAHGAREVCNWVVARAVKGAN